MSEEHNQIGLILKQYRTKRGLTLEKISNKTKISIQNLNHIEEGEIGSIGGKFYQKSFLKAYCNALRIKDTKLLLLFENKPNVEPVNANSKKNLIKERSPINMEKIPTVPLMIFASVGLLVLFVIGFLKTPDSNDMLASIEPKPDLNVPMIEQQTNTLVEELQKIKNEAPLQQTTLKLDDIDNLSVKDNYSFIKKIVAKEDVWIEIKDANENIIISTILKKNESFNLPSDKDEMRISASNAGALFLKNNNQDHDLGSKGTTLNSVNLNSLITNH